MAINRRHLLLGSLSGAALYAAPLRAAPDAEYWRPQGLDAAQFGVHPNAAGDQSHKLQRAIDEAASTHAPLWLAPGVYHAGDLKLRAGSRLIGVRGETRLVLTQGPSLISAQGVNAATLTDLTFDGGRRPLAPDGGLVNFTAAKFLRIVNCAIAAAGGNGVAFFQCSGEVSGNTVTDAADNALFSSDSRLAIRANRIASSGNGGIRVWQSVKRSDGSMIEDNTIEDTFARAGGTGQNGNAINVYRAGNVTVRNNVIRRAAFSAIRGNAASHIQMIGNRCYALEEVAIYCEFEFEDALIADNLVDGAALGIAVTNFDKGGRLAVVRGNTIRNLVNRRPQGGTDSAGLGIGVEAYTTVTGNVIENAPNMGIEVGSGKYLRDVSVTANVVRMAGIGIGVSVVEGAGPAVISDNLIVGSKRGAILGMAWDEAVTGDLAKGGAERYPQLRIAGNRTD
jgi:uncharacterized secreted repeat protein (TIGR03808 family)